MSPSSDFRSNSGPNLSQRLLDEEILASEKHTLHLKMQRNACAEISKLPEDILRQIFAILASSSPLPCWYQINLVCRQWRDTALGTVALWTNPPTHRHDLTLIMLERAKLADLYITFRGKTSPRTVVAVLAHTKRIRSLSLANLSSSLIYISLETLKSYTRISPHRLQNLTIQGFDTTNPYVSRNQFDWDLFPLPGLVSLTLENVFLFQLINMRHLLLAFRDMPKLEHVAIQAAELFDNSNDVLPSKHIHAVHLLHLTYLKIQSNVTHNQMSYLLSHLRLPQLDRLQLECSREKGSASDREPPYSSFWLVIMETVANGNFTALDTFRTFMDTNVLLIRQEESGLEEGVETVSHGVVVQLNGYGGFTSPSRCFALDVGAAISQDIAANLVQLELYDIWTSEDDILSLLCRVPNVETIKIFYECVETLTAALAMPPSHPPGSAPPVLPNIKQILLEVLEDDEPESQPTHDFCTALKARFDYGTPIERLYIDSEERLDEDSTFYSLEEIGVEIILV